MSINTKDLKEFILKEGKEALEANSVRYKNLEEWTKRFEALRSIACLNDDVKKTPWYGASNVGIPLDATVVYTILARLLRAVFGVYPPIAVRPADLPYSPYIQRGINWIMWEHMDMFMNTYMNIQGMLIDGDRVVKTVWDRDEVFFDDDMYLYLNENDEPLIDEGTGSPMEATDEKAKPMGHMGMIYTPKPAQMQKNRVIYLGPRDISIPAKRFIVPQDADHPDPSRLRWNIHEFWKPYGWVHTMAERFPDLFDKDEVDDLRKDKDKDRSIEEDSKQRTMGIDFKTKTKNYKFWEWHGRFEDKKGNEHEIVALLCPEEKKLLGYLPNRFYFKTKRRQFVHFTAFPMNDRFYGKGIPEWLRGIRSMLDGMVNTSLDRNSINSNPPITYDKNFSGFDPDEHKTGPGRSWGLKDRTKVGYLEAPVNHEQIDMARETMLFDMVQKLFGVTDYALGRSGGGAKAKGNAGIMALINEGNIRFDVLIKIFQEWSNPELANQIFKHTILNFSEFMEEEDINKPMEIFGPLAQVPQQKLLTDFEYIFKGNTATINPQQEQERVAALFGMHVKMRNPFVVDDPDVMHDLTEQSFEAYQERKAKIKSVKEFRAMHEQAPREAQAQRKAAAQKAILQAAGAQQQPQEEGATA